MVSTRLTAEPKSQLKLKIFVSYSRHDQDCAAKLSNALSEHQRSTWIDWQDIPPSADWRESIRNGIVSAHTLLLLISPDSIQSIECRKELEFAIEHHKRLIAVVCRDVPPPAVHPAVAALNWIFLRPCDSFDRAMTQLLQAIDTDLDYAEAHTRWLVRAFDWQHNNYDRSLLLQGQSLEAAENWLVHAAEKNPPPASLHREFVAASRRSQTAIQNKITAAITAGLALTSMLGLIAFFQYRDAEASRKTAIAQQIRALSTASDSLFSRQEFQSLLQGLQGGKIAPDRHSA